MLVGHGIILKLYTFFFYIAQQEKRKEGNESGQNDVVERKMKEVRLRNGSYVTCKCSRREGAK